ncbi:transposase [Erwinia tracheiphila PSU-1]|nr:transposase [Erwinia tracheiphila PSU-1]
MNRFRRVLARREKTSENDGALLHFSCGLIVWNKALLRQALIHTINLWNRKRPQDQAKIMIATNLSDNKVIKRLPSSPAALAFWDKDFADSSNRFRLVKTPEKGQDVYQIVHAQAN